MNSITEQSIHSLADEFYEGAGESDREMWQHAYERVSALIASGPGSVYFQYKSDNKFETIANTNVPGFVENFNSVYFHLLPYRDEMLSLRSGEEFLMSRDFPSELVLDSELYRDHWERLGIFEILHYCLFDDDEVTGGITFTRPREAGPFTGEDLGAARILLPHIQRAARVHLKIEQVSGKDRMMREAWNHLHQPVMIVSDRRRFVFLNDAAERLLKERDGFWLGRSGRIDTTVRAEAEILSELISGVFGNGSGSNGLGGRAQITRRGRRPLIINVTPFKEHNGTSASSERFALVIVNDPEKTAGASEEELRTVYALTRSEARVARLLGEGRSLASVCEILDISSNTARTHLKRIYTKTGTNRQSSLVRLMMQFPSPAN